MANTASEKLNEHLSSRAESPCSPFLLSSESETDLTAESLEEASWTVQDSEKLYCVKGWGNPYFSVNQAGHIAVHPLGGTFFWPCRNTDGASGSRDEH
jgi:hypothetical protein